MLGRYCANCWLPQLLGIASYEAALPQHHKHNILSSMLASLQVDGTSERLLMRRLAVDSFPSLFLIDRSSTRKYQGIRAVEQVRAMPC